MPAPRLSTTVANVRRSVFADLSPWVSDRAARGQSLIPLHVGDTFLAPPILPTRVHADETLHRYGPLGGRATLRRKLGALHDADPEREILMAAGATHALSCVFRAMLEPGDEVVVATPYWPLIVGVIQSSGGIPVEAPVGAALSSGGSLLDALLGAVTERTRAVYVATPNNPDGTVLSGKHLQSLAEVAVRENLWLVSDEVYSDFVFDGVHTSARACARDRVVTAHSFSKSLALAGARVGYVVGPEPLLAAAKKVVTHTIFHNPLASEWLCEQAFDARAPFLEQALGMYWHLREVCMSALSRMPVTFHPPAGATYVFVNFANVLQGRPLLDFLRVAIDEGVLLAPGEAFGAGYETYARLCFTAVAPQALEEGLVALGRAIERF